MRQEGGAGTGYGLGWRVGGLDAPLDDAIRHTGATPGYSAMLFLLPRQNVALVLQQNLYGLLRDAAIMQVGFGAAGLLAGGTPGEASSWSAYLITVWATTVLAIAMILVAARSALRVRRAALPTTPRRRITRIVTWSLAGVVPLVATLALISRVGLGVPLIWVPDVFIGGCAAAAAGTAAIVLRLVLAIRSSPSA